MYRGAGITYRSSYQQDSSSRWPSCADAGRKGAGRSGEGGKRSGRKGAGGNGAEDDGSGGNGAGENGSVDGVLNERAVAELVTELAETADEVSV